ncbi:MAG TPA: hypothetical protein PK445_07740 [Methanolinea sp.]|nr:hypothetical protein [Methanolinea sp.]HRU80669.1 hypothetical protein [Methanolinea sp.]
MIDSPDPIYLMGLIGISVEIEIKVFSHNSRKRADSGVSLLEQGETGVKFGISNKGEPRSIRVFPDEEPMTLKKLK